MNEIIRVKGNIKNGLEKYNRKVYKLLVLPKKPRKVLYDCILSGIEDYLADHPLATYEELTEHFGTPKELVDTYVSTSNYKEMYKAQKQKRLILKALLCMAIALVSTVLIWVTMDLYIKTSFQNGYIVRSVQDNSHTVSSLPNFGGDE